MDVCFRFHRCHQDIVGCLRQHHFQYEKWYVYSCLGLWWPKFVSVAGVDITQASNGWVNRRQLEYTAIRERAKSGGMRAASVRERVIGRLGDWARCQGTQAASRSSASSRSGECRRFGNLPLHPHATAPKPSCIPYNHLGRVARGLDRGKHARNFRTYRAVNLRESRVAKLGRQTCPTPGIRYQIQIHGTCPTTRQRTPVNPRRRASEKCWAGDSRGTWRGAPKRNDTANHAPIPLKYKDETKNLKRICTTPWAPGPGDDGTFQTTDISSAQIVSIVALEKQKKEDRLAASRSGNQDVP